MKISLRIRKNQSSHKGLVTTFALALVLSTDLLPCAEGKTTVFFDGANLVDGPIPRGYASYATSDGPGFSVSMGAAVIGTPSIYVEWYGTDFVSDWDARGSVAKFNHFNGNSSGLVFFSETMVINSFDLDLRSGSAPVDVNWTLMDMHGIAASGRWQRETPGRDTVIPLGRVTDFGDHFLSFYVNSGDLGSFALDNLVFDQVPEPSVSAFALFGAVFALARRR